MDLEILSAEADGVCWLVIISRLPRRAKAVAVLLAAADTAGGRTSRVKRTVDRWRQKVVLLSVVPLMVLGERSLELMLHSLK